MVAKSRLQAALLREKGVDFEKLMQKKKHKAALREKQKSKGPVVKDVDEEMKDAADEESEDEDEEENENVLDIEAEVSGEDSEDDEDEEESDEEEEEGGVTLANLAEDDESTSESELDDDDQPGDEDEEDIDLEEIEDQLEEDEDIVPFQRTTINNTTALLAALKRIAIPTGKDVPFNTHQVIVSTEAATEAEIPDVSDDTNRELKFLAQSLQAARKARELLRKEGVPFTRPNDYFAEMLKPEEQMEKVKAKLIEVATAKKAAAEARKQRDLKKFGKQVQIAKQQERAKQKRETLEKIKTLKRKRADGSSGELGVTEAEDLFDVAIDNELSGTSKNKSSGGKKRPGAPHGAPSAKRQRKDAKYGFGGKKRHSKSGDAMSSGDLSGFNTRKMKSGGGGGRPGAAGGKAKRPGKARRQASAAKR